MTRRRLRWAAVICACLVLHLTGSAGAAVLRVPLDFPTIQSAIDAAAAGDTVRVAPGTYGETLSIDVTLALVSEAGAEVTTIDAAGQGTAIRVDANAVVIRGFRVRKGDPGGINANGVGVEICENIIEDNESLTGVGAIEAFNATAIEDNVIQRNNLFSGGDSNVTVINAPGVLSFRRNTVRDNGWTSWGVSIALSGRSLNETVIADNLFVEHQNFGETILVYFTGGGVFRSNTFAGNNVATSMFVSTGPDEIVTLTNNVIVHPPGTVGLECSLMPQGGFHEIACNDVWGGDDSYTGHCDVLEGYEGNISADPLFCDPDGGDYRLAADSPAAPANAPEGCGLMGALPVACGAASIATAPPGAESRVLLLSNPATRTAHFRIEEVAGSDRLQIYDVNGRLVDTVRAAQDVLWSPAKGRAGIYFARWEAGGRGEVTKFVIVH